MGESDTERVAGTGDLGTDEHEHWWYVFTEQQSAGLQHQGGGRAAEILAERTADGTEFRGTAVFSDKVHHGDAAGPGVVYGYSFPLGKRFNLELSAGVSVMWYREAKYDKGTEMPKEYNVTGRKVMPMGLGISCSYIFK